MEHIEVQKTCECIDCMIKTIYEMQYFQTIVLGLLLMALIGGVIIYASVKESV